MFGKYAGHILNFQKTLDNFYSHQHKDGYISRQLFRNVNGERYAKYDPASTGPNILPWAEWEYYCITKDTEWLKDEQALLYKLMNEQVWDDEDAFYYDMLR